MKQVLITAVLSMSFFQGMQASAVQANKPAVNPEAKVLADFKTRIDGMSTCGKGDSGARR